MSTVYMLDTNICRFIAGHALAAGCTLVTNNIREFTRVRNLIAEDWAKD